MNRRAFLRGFTLATSGLFVPRIVRAVPPPLLDRTLRRKASNDALNVGLVGAWTLAAGNGLTDWSGHGNNGTGNGTGFTLGGAANHLGQAGRATTFVAASNQYVSMGNVNNIGANPFTLSAWVLASNANQQWPIISKRHTTSNFEQYQLMVGHMDSLGNPVSSKNIGVFLFDGTGPISNTTTQSVYTSDSVLDGGWHHILTVRNGAAIHIYIDGIDKTLTTVDGGAIINPTNVGNFQLGWAGAGSYVDGSISDIRTYNRALPPSQIQSLMLAGLEDPAFAREFWSHNPNHFLRPAWEERMAA